MKVWVIDRFKNQVVPEERPQPFESRDELLVAVKANSLNYHDLLALQAPPGGSPRHQFIAGTDFAGEVIAVGSNVTGWKAGDRVCGAFYPYWHNGDIADNDLRVGGDDIDGVFAEYLVRNPQSLVKISDSMSYEEAATLPCAALTAWNGLNAGGGMVGKGQTVLTLGTGGVSLFALQLARAAGADVIVTSSSCEKLARAKQLGATGLVNYRENEGWDSQVLELTGGRGVDRVIETGGSGTFGRSHSCTKLGGILALIGMVDMTPSTVTPLDIFLKKLQVHGIRVGNTNELQNMLSFVDQHQIKPVIDSHFAFDELPKAYVYLKSATHFGKVVISL